MMNDQINSENGIINQKSTFTFRSNTSTSYNITSNASANCRWNCKCKLTFTCSKSTAEALDKGVKYVRSLQ